MPGVNLGMRAGCLALVLALVPAAVSAEVRTMRHGTQLTAADVGPAAIGVKPTKEAGFTTLSETKIPAIAREIGTGATYDGQRVAGPHLLIEGVAFKGRLDIQTARPVVVRGCTFRLADYYGILTRAQSRGVLLLFNDIGPVTTAGAPDDATNRLRVGIGISGEGSVVYRNHIHDSEDGIQIGGATDTGVIENLIERLVYYKDSHPDGLQIVKSAKATRILRNRILNPLPTTSAIIFDSRTGLVDGMTIEGNYLAGGGWTLYAGSHLNGSLSRNVRIVGNVFGRDFFPKSGSFGAITYWDPRQGTIGDNRLDDGRPLP